MVDDHSPHPLKAYLDRRRERAYIFARRAGMSSATIHHIVTETGMHGRPIQPTLATLQRIQEATKGEVTVSRMVRWYQQQSQEQANGQGVDAGDQHLEPRGDHPLNLPRA